MVFEIEVNNKLISARKGETILQTLTQNGLSVPTLCYMEGFTPTGACRLCVVEVEGQQDLIPACSHKVEEWMSIKTHSPRVVEARKTIVELLLANHPDDCLYCVRNGNCGLQRLAEELNVNERRFTGKKSRFKTDPSSTSMIRDQEKCILCGRCVRVCEELTGVSTLDFIRKGDATSISTALNKPLNLSNCIACGQCIMMCPTGSLYEKSHFSELQDALHNPDRHVVIQYSPAVPITIAEEFGMKAGKDISGLLNAALRKIGFEKVFNTAFAGDIQILEIATELADRLESKQNMPLFSSCCPSWIKFVEQTHADLLPRLSVCKSPQQILGAIIKSHYAKMASIAPENIYTASVMPCIARKMEAQREEMTNKGIAEVDVVLTTRELIRLIKLYGIEILHNESENADAPYSSSSSAGVLSAVSGGLTEAVIRTLHYKLTGRELTQAKLPETRQNKPRKEFTITMGSKQVGFAIINGMVNAKSLLDQLAAGRTDIHFVEVMACAGGCVCGGGQPISIKHQDLKARIKAIYDFDEKESIKLAHKNPIVNDLYNNYLNKEGKAETPALLSTSYHKREALR